MSCDEYVKVFEEKFNAMTKHQISPAQRGALHLWFEKVAQFWCDQGVDMRTVVTLPIRPTKDIIKENVWKVVMKSKFSHLESTEDMSWEELNAIYDDLNVWLAEGVPDRGIPPTHIPFPTLDELRTLGRVK